MITKLDIQQFQPTCEKTIWDVRDIDSYQSGHIEYARHQPLDSLNQELLDKTTGTIYVLCGGGTKAERAVKLLNDLDPSRTIVHLVGGTRAAIACGMTIVQEDKNNP